MAATTAAASAASTDVEVKEEKKPELSFPKNQIKVLLLERVSPEAIKMFQKEGFQVESARVALALLLRHGGHCVCLFLVSQLRSFARRSSASTKRLKMNWLPRSATCTSWYVRNNNEERT